MYTYGKIIYQLLQGSGSKTAMPIVNAVLERISKQNMQPSPQIYTMLAEHYFDQEPPDLDAVRNLIDRASSVIGNTDNIFWDRLVEGYARVGETGPALRILGKVQSARSKVGWLALRTLLLALYENKEWDLAKTLVRNAIADTGGPLPADHSGAEGQHKFWKLAAELNLLDKR
jgi:hypothetical protein